jgi:hypothetical protein
MTQYFSKFPKIAYDITGTNQFNLVTDIIHRAKFREVVKNTTLLWYPYTIKDGETPDIIAHKLYGSSQYHWLVMHANDIHLLWRDWPLSYNQFIAHLTKKYGDVETSMTQIHHYEDSLGNWIDAASYLGFSGTWTLYASPDATADQFDITVDLVTQSADVYLGNGGIVGSGQNYYIDPINGDDSNSGTSFITAWKTTTKADTQVLSEGDAIWYNTSLDPITISDSSNKIVYAYDYESNLNDAKRDIQLIDAKYVNVIEEELDKILKPMKR